MRLVISLIVSLILVLPLSAYALVNINTAGVEELDSLYRIGPAKAQDIIDYRNGPNGPFETIEEIMEVSGIGTATFEKIKAEITVGTVVSQELKNEENVQATQTTNQTTDTGGGGFVEDTGSISVKIESNHTVFVGADSVFEAQVLGLIGEPLDGARVLWSFGNGDRKEGEKVLYNFAYPGKYVVVVEASSGKYSASARVIIEAIPAQITLTEVTRDYVALVNESDVELDLGGWMLAADGKHFIFPQYTIVLPHEEVHIANSRTGVVPPNPYALSLLYPNGFFAASYQDPLLVSTGRTMASSDTAVATTKSAATAQEEIANGIPSQELITAPILAVRSDAASQIPIPPIIGWLVALFALIGIAIVGVLFVRKGEYTEYSIKEIQ